MKKTVTVILLLTTVTVFFCAYNVFAATPNTITRKTTSRVVDNVTATLNVAQLYQTVISGNASGGAYTPVLVTLQLYNNNDVQALVDNVRFSLTVEDANGQPWLDVVNYSSDLSIGTYGGTWFSVIPSSDFSYGNGIVIPPKESLYLVCEIFIQADYVNNAYVVDTLQSVSIGTFTVAASSVYPYGTPVDFSPISSTLNNIYNEISSIDTSTDNIESTISNISGYIDTLESLIGTTNTSISNLTNRINALITQLTWSGTYNSAGFGSRSNKTINVSNELTVAVQSFNGIPVTDFEILPPDVVVTDVLYRIPVCIRISTNYSEEVRYTGNFRIDGLFTSVSTAIDEPSIISNFIENITYSVTNNLYNVNVISGDRIIPSGYHVSTIWLDVYSRNSALDVTNSTCTVTVVSSDNELNGVSNDIASQTANVHSQEEAYYQQNQSAIEATGLSNYRFSSYNGQGIGAVSNDFTDLWNALGSFTSVYIFSLTLGVALTIIRHAPNAISRLRRRKDGNTE